MAGSGSCGLESVFINVVPESKGDMGRGEEGSPRPDLAGLSSRNWLYVHLPKVPAWLAHGACSLQCCFRGHFQ